MVLKTGALICPPQLLQAGHSLQWGILVIAQTNSIIDRVLKELPHKLKVSQDLTCVTNSTDSAMPPLVLFHSNSFIVIENFVYCQTFEPKSRRKTITLIKIPATGWGTKIFHKFHVTNKPTMAKHTVVTMTFPETLAS